MVAKNIGRLERWVRMFGGVLLIFLGIILTGWPRWISGFAGAALVLTSAFGY
ncbi:MAG: DUF2892 domain-containing protein [Candidatus Binatia bacterium]